MPLKHSDRHYAQIYSYFMHNLNSVRLSVFQDTQRVEQIESECLKRIEEGALPGHKIISSGDRGERSPSYFGISTLTLNLLSLKLSRGGGCSFVSFTPGGWRVGMFLCRIALSDFIVIALGWIAVCMSD